jgi:hypothetical protein
MIPPVASVDQNSCPEWGVATATTLLAALWRDQHVVFDQRVHRAANGLRIVAGMAPVAGCQFFTQGAHLRR